jgi:hypothetical protein
MPNRHEAKFSVTLTRISIFRIASPFLYAAKVAGPKAAAICFSDLLTAHGAKTVKVDGAVARTIKEVGSKWQA